MAASDKKNKICPVRNMKNGIMAWHSSRSPLMKGADILSLLVIAAGIIVSIRMNMVGRSLWVDEAMLAFSFSKRDFFHLIDGVFEWDQSAPVLYLYITKLITLVFGNTEAVLRSVSIISYVLMLGLTALVAHRVFRIRYSLQAAAVLANMNFMLTYSNMFKQYMFECTWVLLVLLIYDLYRRDCIGCWQMTAAFMLFIWGANPSCFFMGGVLLNEFAEGVLAQKRTGGKEGKLRWQNSIKSGIGIAASFAVYYFVWLKEVAVSSAMQSYWQNADFPLIPRSLDDIKMAKAMIYEIFITYREGWLFVLWLAAAGLVIGIFLERDRYVRVTGLGFLVCLFASFIHMFPIADRLWCFSFPVFIILAFVAVDRMGTGSRRAELGAIALIVALIATNNGIMVYRHSENVYMPTEEANHTIAYADEHIEEGEMAYIYYQTIPLLCYKKGYDVQALGSGLQPNIIWGQAALNRDTGPMEIEKVLNTQGCYIIVSHVNDQRISPLLDACRERGHLELMTEFEDTPLYYYSPNVRGMKARVNYELVDREDMEEKSYVTIRVTNTGISTINALDEGVRITSRDSLEVATNLYTNLKPGESYEIPMEIEWEGLEKVDLQLYWPGEASFWADELGIEPIRIGR